MLAVPLIRDGVPRFPPGLLLLISALQKENCTGRSHYPVPRQRQPPQGASTDDVPAAPVPPTPGTPHPAAAGPDPSPSRRTGRTSRTSLGQRCLSTLYDRSASSPSSARHAVSQVGESLSSLEELFSTSSAARTAVLGQLSEIDGLLRPAAPPRARHAPRAAAPADSVAVFLLTRDPNGMADLAEALRETTCETVTFSETTNPGRRREATPQAIVADTTLCRSCHHCPRP